jgi:signal peptidase I
MGDNRGNSKDSRYIGAISGNLIVGRAFVRVWPLSKLSLF